MFEHLRNLTKSEKTNKLYYVSTNLTLDAGLETMIFEIKNGKVDWAGVFTKHYSEVEYAVAGHYEIVNNIDKHI